jgi:hypothetical protein
MVYYKNSAVSEDSRDMLNDENTDANRHDKKESSKSDDSFKKFSRVTRFRKNLGL